MVRAATLWPQEIANSPYSGAAGAMAPVFPLPHVPQTDPTGRTWPEFTTADRRDLAAVLAERPGGNSRPAPPAALGQCRLLACRLPAAGSCGDFHSLCRALAHSRTRRSAA